MKTLTLRIYLTVVAVLALFAFGSGWLFQHQLQQERTEAESALSERVAAWGELVQRSLPPAHAPAAEQSQALHEWAQRLRLPLALDGAGGERIAASELFRRRVVEAPHRLLPIRLEDGRTLWVVRPGLRLNARGAGGPAPAFGVFAPGQLPWQRGLGLVVVLLLLFVAVAVGAWPVAKSLTGRLKALQRGVEAFGAGDLQRRVEVRGRDEVAAVAASFNEAADRIQALLRSHKSLLANASHELRSPLARLKMAVAMAGDATPVQRERLKEEIDTNIAELDALVEEVLLASRLDALQDLEQRDKVDLLGLAAEEAARIDATLEADSGVSQVSVVGDERLLRRALRNLLENARRYGGEEEVTVVLQAVPEGMAVQVCDRGPGVPPAFRERIFEPFYRLPGHAEMAGGVGLGLSLVKQIAERHGGTVRCEGRSGPGSCFVLTVPATR